MAMLILKTEIPVEFDTIVDRRTVVHELALDDRQACRWVITSPSSATAYRSPPS
jgi:hypothetical protein